MKYASPLVVSLVALTAATLVGCRTTFDAVRLNQDAQVYIAHGRYDAARQLLEDSLDVDFENSASHYWLGQCFEHEGNLLKAIYHYRLAVRFDPSMELGQLALIDAYLANEQPGEALKAAEAFLAHEEGSSRHFLPLAEAFAERGHTDIAILTYQRAQDVAPRDPMPSLALAEYCFSVNREQAGLDALATAFKIDPTYPGLARRLGEHGLRVEVPRPQTIPPRDPVREELMEQRR